MSHAGQDHPRCTGHSGEFWKKKKKRNPLEEGMANHLSIFAMRTTWTVWKGKTIWHWKMSPQGWKVSKMPLGKSRGQFLIASKKMKWLNQSRNNDQLWTCLVMELKSEAVKNSIAEEPGMLGPWIKVNWRWSSRIWQE